VDGIEGRRNGRLAVISAHGPAASLPRCLLSRGLPPRAPGGPGAQAAAAAGSSLIIAETNALASPNSIIVLSM
jgi:hypothetical protein